MGDVAQTLAELLDMEAHADDAAARQRLSETARARKAVVWASTRDAEIAKAANTAKADMEALCRAADARERERRRIAEEVKGRIAGAHRRAGARSLGSTLDPADLRSVRSAAKQMQERMRQRKAELDLSRTMRVRDLEAKQVFRIVTRAAAFEEACAFGELGLYRAATSAAMAVSEARLSHEMAREREHAKTLAQLLAQTAEFLSETSTALVDNRYDRADAEIATAFHARTGSHKISLSMDEIVEQAIALAGAARAGVAADSVRARRVDAACAAARDDAAGARAHAERAAAEVLRERDEAARRMQELEMTNRRLSASLAAAREQAKEARARREDADALADELQHRCSKIASQRGAAAFFEIAKLASVPQVQSLPQPRPADSASSTPAYPTPTPPAATPPKWRRPEMSPPMHNGRHIVRAPMSKREDSCNHYSHTHRRVSRDGSAGLVSVSDAEAIISHSPKSFGKHQASVHDTMDTSSVERLYLARERLGSMKSAVRHLRRDVADMQVSFGAELANLAVHVETAMGCARVIAGDAVAVNARANVAAAAHVTLRRVPLTWGVVRPMLSSDLNDAGVNFATPGITAHGGFSGCISVAGVPGSCTFDRVACAGGLLDLASREGCAALATDVAPLAAHALSGGRSAVWLVGAQRGGATTTAISSCGGDGAFVLAARTMAAEAESERRARALAASVGAGGDSSDEQAVRFAVSLVEVNAAGVVTDTLTVQAAAAHAEWRVQSSMREARALLTDSGVEDDERLEAGEAAALLQLRLLADAVGDSARCFTGPLHSACFVCAGTDELMAFVEAATVARHRATASAADHRTRVGAATQRHFVLQLMAWRRDGSSSGVLSVVDATRLNPSAAHLPLWKSGFGDTSNVVEDDDAPDASVLANAALADAPGAVIVMCHVAASGNAMEARNVLSSWSNL